MRTGTGALNLPRVAQGAGAPAQAKRRETALGTVGPGDGKTRRTGGRGGAEAGKDGQGGGRRGEGAPVSGAHGSGKRSARLRPRAWKSTGFAEPRWPEREDGARLRRV